MIVIIVLTLIMMMTMLVMVLVFEVDVYKDDVADYKNNTCNIKLKCKDNVNIGFVWYDMINGNNDDDDEDQCKLW